MQVHYHAPMLFWAMLSGQKPGDGRDRHQVDQLGRSEPGQACVDSRKGVLGEMLTLECPIHAKTAMREPALVRVVVTSLAAASFIGESLRG